MWLKTFSTDRPKLIESSHLFYTIFISAQHYLSNKHGSVGRNPTLHFTVPRSATGAQIQIWALFLSLIALSDTT